MKSRALTLLALLLALFVLACDGAGERTSGEPAEGEVRILSLAPNLTEMLFALGLGDHVVGVTDFCRYPPEAANLPTVGGWHDVTVERTVVLDPTHVVFMGTPSDAVRRLQGRGLQLVEVRSESIEDITAGILKLGGVFDRKEEAARLVDEIAVGIEESRARYAGREPRAALYVVGHAPGALREVYVAGPGTFLDEFLQIAHAPNIMAESAAPYPLLSREWAMRHRPEVILTTRGDGGRWTEREKTQVTQLWRDYLALAPEATLHLVFLDDPHLTIPGPSVARSAARIAAMIHGTEEE